MEVKGLLDVVGRGVVLVVEVLIFVFACAIAHIYYNGLRGKAL